MKLTLDLNENLLAESSARSQETLAETLYDIPVHQEEEDLSEITSFRNSFENSKKLEMEYNDGKCESTKISTNSLESPQHDARTRRLKYAILLCFALFVLQFIGGYISSSLALMADAFHMLSDVIGYSISLSSIILGTVPPCKSHPFGKKRLEILGALSSIALLWVLTFGLVSEAIERLYNPREINGKTMLVMAIGGVVVNAILIGIFGHPEDEDDDDVQVYVEEKNQKEKKTENFQEISLEAESFLASALNSSTASSRPTSDINIKVLEHNSLFDS